MSPSDPAEDRSARPLADRVAGTSPTVMAQFRQQRFLRTAAWAPLRTGREIRDAVDGGAAVVTPLALVHAVVALGGFSNGHIGRGVIHCSLTAIALGSYYAIQNARSVLPSGFVLAWLLFEITLAKPLLGYPWGASALNWIVLPLAVLSVRAAWVTSRSGPHAVIERTDSCTRR